MNEKKNFSQRAGQFLAGRGFYIVLFLCTAVIGISAWVLLFPSNNLDRTASEVYTDYSSDLEQYVFAPETAKTTAPPTIKPVAPTPLPPPTPTPAPTPDTKPSTVTEPDDNGADIPVIGPMSIEDLKFARPIAGSISMEFAIDTLVYSRTMGDWRTHKGVDIAASLGAKVLAVCDGRVTDIKKDDLLGTMVFVDHSFNLSSVYANLAATPAVNVGDEVSQGSVIGSIGNTALGETGEVTHLHFEMKLAGANVDPFKYIPG